jgi:hypothetical protein
MSSTNEDSFQKTDSLEFQNENKMSLFKIPCKKVINILNEIKEFLINIPDSDIMLNKINFIINLLSYQNSKNLIGQNEFSDDEIKFNRKFKDLFNKKHNKNIKINKKVKFKIDCKKINCQNKSNLIKRSYSERENKSILKKNLIKNPTENNIKDIEKVYTLTNNSSIFKKIYNEINYDINNILSKEFNIHEFKDIVGYNKVLPLIGKKIFQQLSLNKIINVNKLESFLNTISKNYNCNVYYHNAIHASDVANNILIYNINSNIKEKLILNNYDILSMIIASLGHDISHPGLNANYLINNSHPLAIIYNDISPLENFHISTLFKLMNNPKNNILDNIKNDDYRLIRKRIIGQILATDMVNHSKVFDSVKNKISNEKNKVLISKDNKNLFNEQQTYLDFILHAADISHNAKKFNISIKWVDLLYNELWEQGDKEKSLNIPISFLCDRENLNIPKSQIYFINTFIKPTFNVLIELFPSLNYLSININNNINDWTKLYEKKRKTGFSQEKNHKKSQSNKLCVN